MPRHFLKETMCTIKFEIKEPGPVAIKVVNVINLTQSTFFQTYDYPGEYEFDFDEKKLTTSGEYYYRFYDIKGLDSIAIKALDGKERLLDSGNLINGHNGFNKLKIIRRSREMTKLLMQEDFIPEPPVDDGRHNVDLETIKSAY